MHEHAGAGLEGLLDKGYALGESRKEVARVRVLQALDALVRELLCVVNAPHARTRGHDAHAKSAAGRHANRRTAGA